MLLIVTGADMESLNFKKMQTLMSGGGVEEK